MKILCLCLLSIQYSCGPQCPMVTAAAKSRGCGDCMVAASFLRFFEANLKDREIAVFFCSRRGEKPLAFVPSLIVFSRPNWTFSLWCPNGYQNKRVPNVNFVKLKKNLPFWHPSALKPLWVLLKSETGLSEFFGPHRVPGRELSEFLSAYYLCAETNSPSFAQNSPSLP